MEEYLRLPRGMHDRNSIWNAHKTEILKLHDQCGKGIGCDVMSYSYVSFKSTFTKDCNITNDKIYEFLDKSGRTLVLTCDSTASILREYLSDPLCLPRRISFISPTFRYWTDSAHNRFFTQLGYCIINEGLSQGVLDIHTIQLTSAMYDFLSELGIKTTIFLNDYTAIKKIFSKYVNDNELKDFIYKFQFSGTEQRPQIIDSVVSDFILKRQLRNIFSSEPMELYSYMSPDENPLDLPNEYFGIYEMAYMIKNTCDSSVFFCPTDLHCIEMMDSYTVRFMINNSFAIAEGGNYSEYAKKFNTHIHSFWSICSGIEPLERTVQWCENNTTSNRVAVFNYGASSSYILSVINSLKTIGYIPCFISDVTNIRSAIKQIKNLYDKFTIIGANEECQNYFYIKDAVTGKTEKIPTLDRDR